MPVDRHQSRPDLPSDRIDGVLCEDGQVAAADALPRTLKLRRLKLAAR